MSDKQTMFQQQKHFMEACGQDVTVNPKQVDLYVNLIAEEFGELTDAWNAAAMAIGTPEFDAEAAIVETVDGIIDTMVVLYGTLVSLGIDGDLAWALVMGDPGDETIFDQVSAITGIPVELNGSEANSSLESLTVWIRAIQSEWEHVKASGKDDEPDCLDAGDMVLGIINAIANAADMLNALGIPGNEAWDEVWSSNMSKLDPSTGKAIFREDGKILKNANYRKPELLPIIKKALETEDE